MMAFHSQYGQDEFVNDLLGGKTDGVFVDIGASDGVTINNSLFFEEDKGWTGLCVEPRNTAFEKLKANRKCKIEQVCISDSAGQAEFFEVEGWGQGLSGMTSQYCEAHRSRLKTELAEHPESTSCLTTKPTVTFMELMEKHGIDHIDYMSLDVEGAEPPIIHSIDYNKIFIDIMTIENNYNEDHLRIFLYEKGYEMVGRLNIDDVFRKKTV